MLPDYTQAVRTFRTALSDAGLYDSRERRLVLHEFWHTGRPVTLDELHEMVAPCPISATTVSRTVELVLSCGLAREMEPQKPPRCWNCGCQDLRVDENRWHCDDAMPQAIWSARLLLWNPCVPMSISFVAIVERSSNNHLQNRRKDQRYHESHPRRLIRSAPTSLRGFVNRLRFSCDERRQYSNQ